MNAFHSFVQRAALLAVAGEVAAAAAAAALDVPPLGSVWPG